MDTLNQLGFSSSYHEVLKYEKSAAISEGVQFIQYVADNVDHNIRTLDDHNTFHGMDIIATLTPGSKNIRSRIIRRKEVTAEELAKIGRISIQYYTSSQNSINDIVYKELLGTNVDDTSKCIDIIWKSSWLLKPERPGWSGVMQLVHHGEHPGQSSIVFIPIIDMDPGNLSCIYSTLNFVSNDHLTIRSISHRNEFPR